MQPKSLSATAVALFEACPRRYEVEYLDGGRRTSGDKAIPAKIGIVCHGAIEHYVNKIIIPGEPHSQKLLLDLADICYVEEFGGERTYWGEVCELLLNWFARSGNDFYWESREVLSTETKMHFDLKAPDGTVVPFNYVFVQENRLSP